MDDHRKKNRISEGIVGLKIRQFFYVRHERLHETFPISFSLVINKKIMLENPTQYKKSTFFYSNLFARNTLDYQETL